LVVGEGEVARMADDSHTESANSSPVADPLRVRRAIAEYLHGHEGGQTFDLAAWQTKYADCAHELNAFLAAEAAFAPTDAGDVPAPPATPPRFADYEILDTIARGGMGVIVRARQVSLNRIVALKMIRAGTLADPVVIARFCLEAEAAAALEHPHILPVYEVGEFAGLHYFSMKLIEGGNLSEQLQKKPLSARAAARLLVKIARAVHFAHQHGILHRDLKPANILLDLDGTPYISDFGLAKRIEGDSCLTQPGAVIGTPSYMAPEQTNSGARLTTAVDVYSLGALLYECLAQRPPFKGSTPFETMRQVHQHDPPHPRASNPKADRDLSTIALKCLAKEPAKRYESANALADELEAWLRHEPIRARSASWLERFAKWSRRRPAAALLSLMLVVVAGIGMVGLAVAYQLIRAEQQQRDVALERTRRTVADLRRVQRNELRLGTAHRIALAHREARAGRVARANQLLSECPQEYRSWEWYFLKHAYAQARHVLHQTDWEGVFGLAYHPHGAGLAVVRGDGCVQLGADGTEPHILAPLAGPRWSATLAVPIAYSADGLWLAYATGAVAVVRSADTGKVIAQIPLTRPAAQLAWLADGQLLTVERGGGGASLWRVTTGERVQRWPATAAAVSPDGQRVLLSVGDHLVERHVSANRILHHFRLELDTPAVIGIPAYSPGGRLVAAVYTIPGTPTRTAVQVWDAATGRRGRRLEPEGYLGTQLTALAFGPDGTLLAAAGTDSQQHGGLAVWDTRTGRLLHRPQPQGEGVQALAFSPDRKWLAVANGNAAPSASVRLWDAAHGREAEVLEPPTPCRTASADRLGRVWALTDDGYVWEVLERKSVRRLAVPAGAHWLVHPETDRLFVHTAAGTIQVLQLSTGQMITQWTPYANGGLGLVRLSADGRRLLTTTNGLSTGVGRFSLHWWDVATGSCLATLIGPEEVPVDVDIRGDAAEFAALYAGRRVIRWSSTGEKLSEWTCPGGVAERIAYHPVGRELAIGSRNDHDPEGAEVALCSAESGQHRLQLSGLGGQVTGLAFNPDGKRLIAADENGRLHLVDAESGEPLLTLESEAQLLSVFFSPDGFRLVAVSKQSILIFDARPPWAP
jgi:WD40 repeat protein/tRNA A-37 threonylcarbamoyl transferase component Bud32